ncbi:proline-rich domain-containing protein [Actinacidiphila acididurans]|uniref:Glycerophosphoryl diester phosphodiesterase membrane domain-containing protein n=1 Tax=Actinacidiphila acididurans TaxID=2784346 RepID=A0ABS2U502_9ACTN|nr:proline-rich domain-containing protein [Actinacidiphila acididurans]MBM9510703.1 hypothetical protein [Actinacidiphila acididurans]
MTNPPGPTPPGSSDSPEPDAGSGTAPPTSSSSSGSSSSGTDSPPSASTATGSGTFDTSAPADTADAPTDGPTAGGYRGWSQRQPPPTTTGWARWSPPPGAPPQQWGGPRQGTPAPGAQQQWGGQRWGWQQQPTAPKPGVIPLRPLGAGEILDGALTTLRLHWRTVIGATLGIALVTETVSVLVQGLFIDDTRLNNLRDNPDPSVGDIAHALSGTVAGGVLTFVVALIGWCAATAVLTPVTSRAVLGRPVSAREAWQLARPRLRHLLALGALLPLFSVGVMAVATLPGLLVAVAGSPSGGASLGVLGGIAGLVVEVWLLVQWSLAAPALILERQGVTAALKRSAKLVRDAWWRVLGVQLLGLLLSTIAQGVISTPFSLLGSAVTGDGGLSAFMSDSSNPGWGFLVIAGVGGAIGSAVTLPITAGVTALLYMDQRIRRESLDLELARATKND